MQNEQKSRNEETPNVQRDDWNAKDIVDESTNKPSDETLREVLRGDESKGDADERDVVGSVETNETPQGREEVKNDKGRDS